MKKILLLLLLSTCLSASALADFTAGEKAFTQKQWGRAYTEFEPLALSGDFRSQYYLGLLYLNGYGTKKDTDKALKFLNISAKQGYDLAETMLGYLYSEGIVVKQNKDKGIDLYETAAEKGNIDALFNLGVAYYNGSGVVKNITTAVDYFLQVSPTQKPIVAKYLGDIYLNEDPVKNPEKAFHYYVIAAQSGDIPSYHALGYMYHNGQFVAKNITDAIKFYTYAASKGHTPSLYALGTIYANGTDVTRDNFKAHAYFSLAAAKDMPEAIQAKKQLEEPMSLSDRDRANKALIEIQQNDLKLAMAPALQDTVLPQQTTKAPQKRTVTRRRRR